MEAQVVVGHDHEAGREAPLLRVEHREARREGLAAAVAAAQTLEDALTLASHVEEAPDLRALPLEPHGERVEPALGHAPRSQLLEHVLGVPTIQGHQRPPSFT